MFTLAVLTGTVPKLGVVLVAILVACTLLLRSQRGRAAAMLGCLVLAPVLLIADIWPSPQLHIVHHHPLLAVGLAALALAAVGVLAIAFARRPQWLGILAVLALPFRVPIQAGGTTSNLLVPLYLVIAAGTLAAVWRRREAREPALLDKLLALFVVLYGLQSTYSSDFEKALQQMVFFYVPFALLFTILRQLEWTPQLIRRCFYVAVGLALALSAIGFAEYATKTLLLNPKLIAANDVHTYFTVNSVFFDPDIFGRFLALVMIGLAVALLYARPPREQLAVAAILAVLWGGLVLTLSRSSLGALLLGLGILAALRWRTWWVLVAGGAVIALGVAAIAIAPKTFGLNQGLNGASSGRADLVSGGLDLFGNRPLWGYGSGSFVHEYQLHNPATAQTLSASHTIPVTIAAEQGVIGEVAYLALVLVAISGLLRGARADPTRAAVAAAFVALVFHTLLYADFLEDPFTWTLLGVGSALALARERSHTLNRPAHVRAGRVAHARPGDRAHVPGPTPL